MCVACLYVDICRTRFQEQDDGTVKCVVVDVDNCTRFPLTLATASSDSELEDLLEAEVHTPFCLTSAPLARALLIQGPGRGKSALIISLHHAISDFWSVQILIQELSLAYDAAAGQGENGENAAIDALPGLTLQYGDFAIWQSGQLCGSLGAQQRAWWKEELRGAMTSLQLPTDRPRPAKPTYASGHYMSSVGMELMHRLDSVATSLGVNVQALLLAALAAVTGRYSGQEEVVLGVPTAGRDFPSTHGIIGYFVNTVAVRVPLEAAQPLAELAQQVSKSVVGALDHSLLPFSEVVNEVLAGSVRQSNINPLFQVMFQFLPDAEALSITMGELNVSCRAAPPPAQAKFDLTINMYASGALDVVYMAELYDPGTIKRIMESFSEVLKSFADNPESFVGDADLLPPSERQLILTRFTPGPVAPEHLRRPTVHDSIAATARSDPLRTALITDDGIVSFGELEARAVELAFLLASRGAKKGDAIAILLDRSADLLASMLATWKVGACYVPLDPDFPDDRLSIYVEDSQSRVVVTTSAYKNRAGLMGGGTKKPQLLVIDDADTMEDRDSVSPEKCLDQKLIPAGPGDVSYIEFTSGSTGRPKGVIVLHSGLSVYCANVQARLDLGADTVALFLTSVNFDAYVRQTWVPLTVAGRTVVARPGGHTDPDYIAGIAAEAGVTYMHAVPTLMLEYMRSPDAPAMMESMRVLGSGGEAMPPRLLELVENATAAAAASDAPDNAPRPRVYNSYGPTECTVSCTCHVGLRFGDAITIGRPDFNMHALIVDPISLRVLPVGVPGELLISGPRLAVGYVWFEHKVLQLPFIYLRIIEKLRDG